MTSQEENKEKKRIYLTVQGACLRGVVIFLRNAVSSAGVSWKLPGVRYKVVQNQTERI